jgi:hypothetical protein
MNPGSAAPVPNDRATACPWRTGAAFAEPGALRDLAPEPTDVIPQLEQGLAPGMAAPAEFRSDSDDAATFASESGLQAQATAPLDQLAVELGALVDAGTLDGQESCSFELELPGLGRIDGRVSIRGGQASLELHATRSGVAAALRSRQHELQKSVEHAARGEVKLFIV